MVVEVVEVAMVVEQLQPVDLVLAEMVVMVIQELLVLQHHMLTQDLVEAAAVLLGEPAEMDHPEL
jgi:hypothetical protein